MTTTPSTRPDDAPTLRHWVIVAIALPALTFIPPHLAALIGGAL